MVDGWERLCDPGGAHGVVEKAMNSDPRIGFDKRFECRTWLALQEGLDDLFALERPLDGGEAEEPESHVWT